jgi:hypothetical protein
MGMDLTGSGSYPVEGFIIHSVEPLDLTTSLVNK